MSARPYPHLTPAELDWADGEPRSCRYGDRYFAHGEGLAESRYVFLRHNRLPERWRDGRPLVVGETGFGTGLNFLATWAAWRDSGAGPLHFVSVERHPLRREDLARALAAWPELAPLARALCDAYPAPVPGFHRLGFEDGRVTLTLLFGDVAELLPQLRAPVDAWFLDGFSPAANERMWDAEVLGQVARASAPGATFATFTAAGWVRRGLEAAGFAVHKAPGFGRKREMLYGHLNVPPEQPRPQPWFRLPAPPAGEEAVVVGAGIAGTAAARALAQRGWRVSLLEREGAPGRAASGNRAGVVMPALTADWSPYGRFHLAAHLFALRQLEAVAASRAEPQWREAGVLQLLGDERERERFAAVAAALGDSGVLELLTPAAAAARAGIDVVDPAVVFPRAGWVRPAALCRALAATDGVELHTGAEVVAVGREGAGWRVEAADGRQWRAPVLVWATGADAAALPGLDWLPLTPVRGQVTELTAGDVALNCPICYEGYVLPAVDGVHCIGATYSPGDGDATACASDDGANLAALRRRLPRFADRLGATPSGHRAGVRATLPGRLPAVGPVPDVAAFRDDYHDLHHGRPAERYPDGSYLPGLYLSTGYGSRGLIGAFLGAELLAAQIAGEPLPLEGELVDALNPARFLVRELRRQGGGGS